MPGYQGPSETGQALPGYLVKRPSQFNIRTSRICTILRRKMPHRPKFDEPWMDELDGNNCVQKSVSLGVKAGMVGEYYVLDVQAQALASLVLCIEGCTKNPSIHIEFPFGELIMY